MRLLVSTAIIALMALASSAQAATYQLGTVSNGSTSKTVDLTSSGNSLMSISDTYYFSLNANNNTLTSSVSTTGYYVVGESLYKETGSGAWVELAGGGLGVTSFVVSGVSPSSNNLFKVVVTGLGAGQGSYTFNGSISSVPLPAALPLFGAALFGLVGLGLRKRKAAKAA